MLNKQEMRAAIEREIARPASVPKSVMPARTEPDDFSRESLAKDQEAKDKFEKSSKVSKWSEQLNIHTGFEALAELLHVNENTIEKRILVGFDEIDYQFPIRSIRGRVKEAVKTGRIRVSGAHDMGSSVSYDYVDDYIARPSKPRVLEDMLRLRLNKYGYYDFGCRLDLTYYKILERSLFLLDIYWDRYIVLDELSIDMRRLDGVQAIVNNFFASAYKRLIVYQHSGYQ